MGVGLWFIYGNSENFIIRVGSLILNPFSAKYWIKILDEILFFLINVVNVTNS